MKELAIILGGFVALLCLAALGAVLIAKSSLDSLRQLQADLERDE